MSEPTGTDDAATIDDADVAEPPGAVDLQGHFGVRTMATTYASGFIMGSADIVPGVSGGTIALVLGIYERLVANIRQGARAASLLVRLDLRDTGRALRHVEWSFLVPLLLGILTAVVTLAGGLRHLLENEPVYLSAAFAGLIVGSVAVSYQELRERTLRTHGLLVISAVATFLLLGLRSGRFEDPSLLVFVGGGALAICAMILPGISGSFILLMIGLYETVLSAVDDREVATLAAVAIGAVVGLAGFSTLLNWTLRRYREAVLAILIGLMAGSLRVLWPWPAQPDGVGNTALAVPTPGEVLPAVGLAIVGAVVVVAVAAAARALSDVDD